MSMLYIYIYIVKLYIISILYYTVCDVCVYILVHRPPQVRFSFGVPGSTFRLGRTPAVQKSWQQNWWPVEL